MFLIPLSFFEKYWYVFLGILWIYGEICKTDEEKEREREEKRQRNSYGKNSSK